MLIDHEKTSMSDDYQYCHYLSLCLSASQFAFRGVSV